MKIICVIGTRPEAIKMAPIINILKKDFDVLTVSTGQHKELLDQTLSVFNLKSDIDLKIMTPGQSILDVLSKSIHELSSIFIKEHPTIVIGQGDTTTALAAAQASYFNKIPFAHVEAGLRTNNFENPWPEEMNRVLISKLSTLHFCPTESAKQNLIKEGYTQNLFVTGNTVIDSLFSVLKNDTTLSQKIILCTVHRRENFGEPLNNILEAILEIVNRNLDISFIFPVHPNPNVKNIVFNKLKHPRIHLCEPMSYLEFCKSMKKSYFILTDSGGVQEEAPAISKPVLVLRDFTERPESVEMGVSKLIGTDKDKIIFEVEKLLTSEKEYNSMAKGISPYGDGKSAERILEIIKKINLAEK